MRTFFALAIAAGSAALVQQAPVVDEVVEGRYESSNGMVIETLGGCRITPPDTISCWDMSGQPSVSIAKQVRTVLMGTSQELSFRFGRDIKYAVVRRTRAGNVNFQTPGGNHLNSISFHRGSDDSQLDLLQIRNEEDGRPMEILASIYNADKPLIAEVPFRKGARVTLGKVEYEVGTAVPLKKPKPQAPNPYNSMYAGNYGNYSPYMSMFMPDSKLWSLGIGFEKQEDRTSLNSVVALDESGRIIRFVDKNGEPAPATTALAENPPVMPGMSPDPNSKPPKYRSAMVNRGGNDINGAFSFVMNVNPTRIGKLQLYSTANRVIRFKGIPVDGKTP
jgi:hypothetical protein